MRRRLTLGSGERRVLREVSEFPEFHATVPESTIPGVRLLDSRHRMERRDRSDWLLALIVFLSLGALGHHKFGTIDAIQRLAVTRAIFHQHSVVTPEFGAVKYGLLQPVLMLPPYALGFLTGKLLSPSGTAPQQVGYRFVAFLFT